MSSHILYFDSKYLLIKGKNTPESKQFLKETIDYAMTHLLKVEQTWSHNNVYILGDVAEDVGLWQSVTLGSNLSTTKLYTNIHSGIVHDGQKGGGNGNAHQQTEDKQKIWQIWAGETAQWVKALTTCKLGDLSSALRTHSGKEPTQQSCPLTPTCTP